MIGSLDFCVADTMPITVRVIVRWLSFRPIRTRISSAWRTNRTTPGHAVHLGSCPKSQCYILTTSTRSCSRGCRVWSSRNADAHSPPWCLTGKRRGRRGRRREFRTGIAMLSRSRWSSSLSSSIVVDYRRHILGDSSSDRLKVPCSESDCVMRIFLEHGGRNTKCAVSWFARVPSKTVLDVKRSPKRDSRRVSGRYLDGGPWSMARRIVPRVTVLFLRRRYVYTWSTILIKRPRNSPNANFIFF